MKKVCTVCKVEKDYSEFSKRKKLLDGHRSQCKFCDSVSGKKYFKTKEGLIARIYGGQRERSKHRGYIMPNYSREELQEWIFAQTNFQTLWDNWVKSNYDKMLVPSCDRDNDYKPYTLDSIKLVTWQDNFDKGHSDRVNGINNKHSKAVLQYDLQGNFINEYHSQMQASRETGVLNGDISACCLGVQKTAGGFIWKFKV